MASLAQHVCIVFVRSCDWNDGDMERTAAMLTMKIVGCIIAMLELTSLRIKPAVVVDIGIAEGSACDSITAHSDGHHWSHLHGQLCSNHSCLEGTGMHHRAVHK